MNNGNFVKGQEPWNKGKLKAQDPDEIRTCKVCKEQKIVSEFTKGKGGLYRYKCKVCRQSGRRLGTISNTRFKPGSHAGKEFQKGQPVWFKVRGFPAPVKGKGTSVSKNSAKSKEWTKKVKERDRWTCTKCGSKRLLAAHHIVPWKENETLRFVVENGITLCCSCHAKEEGLGIKIRP